MIPGSIFEDRFEALRKASSGGMGTVYRARDRTDGVEVALKILCGQDAHDVERFTREATILADLSHPGIVRYIAHGITAAGEHYLAMEWLDGEDLASRLARRGLSIQESLAVVRLAAQALAFAHARGLVHRDLKPSNLFLVRGDVERVKLVDFGIARLGRESQRLTRTGALLGTPGYMAPEQIQGPPAYDPRADVFALGCVLFECLTGRPAFEGMNAMSVLAKILLQEVPRARSLRPGIPERLDDLVARMMARDPEGRPRNGAAVALEIAELGDPAAFPGGAAPAVDPHHMRAMAAASVPSSLTLSEQRLVTVVLAGESVSETDDASISARPEIGELELVIAPHGGVLHVLAGGSLVVTLWGAGSAVDRAARAARCALAIKSLFASLPVCVVTGRGTVSSRVVEGEMIERGVSNLSAARAGGVHLDEVTAGMLLQRFIIEPPAERASPGRAPPDRSRALRPAPVHLLQRERPTAETAPLLLGQATPCVGRARELAMLAGVFSGCVAEPVASSVLVVGEPGAGKSRLRREFIEALRARGDDVEVFAGAGDSLGTGAPYRMVAEALRRAAGIGEDDSIEVRRHKLRSRVGRHLETAARDTSRGDAGTARVIHFLGELCGTPFPDGGDEALRAARDSARLMGDAVRAAWEEFLAAECAAHPVVLVLEDLQWGDAATVRLLDSTLRNLRDLPLMILVLARPDVHERFPALWAEREVQSIRLGPLPRKSSEQIVRTALGPSASDTTVARLVDQAEGNPFYLEELVRAVAAGRADVLPDSVLGTVEARLDAEGSEAKRVLRAASVFGDRFSLGGALALLGGEGRAADVAGWLEALVSRELIAPSTMGSPLGAAPSSAPKPPSTMGSPLGAAPSSAPKPPSTMGSPLGAAPSSAPKPPSTMGSPLGAAPSSAPKPPSTMGSPLGAAPSSAPKPPASTRVPTTDPHYVFCHALVREAAYATLTEDDRLLGHRLAAEWLERADLPDAMALAEHLRRGDDATRAVRWYLRAAEQALDANDFAAALDRVARGVACGATGEELGHLRLCQAEADGWRGELAAAEEGGLAALAELAPGSLPWFRALTQTVMAAGELGGFERIGARAELAVATAPAPGARSAQLVCLTECASFLLLGGRRAASEAILARLQRAVGDPAMLDPVAAARLQQLFAVRASYAGDPGASLEGFEAALSSLEAAGDDRNACVVRSNLGSIFAELGDFESAEEALRGALTVAERMGLGDLALVAMQNLGNALAHRGHLDEARRHELRAVDAFRRLGNPRREGVARTYLARIELLAGNLVHAEREARAAAVHLAVAPPMHAVARAMLARVLLAAGRTAEALSVAIEAQTTLDELGELEEGEALVRLVYAEALLASGALEDHARAVRTAKERLLRRADRISDPEWKLRFLTAVPDNARTIALTAERPFS